MLAIGQMNHLIKIQNPVTTKDGLGSPVLTWQDYQEVYAAIENDTYSSEESNSAPHESNTQSRVYIIRNHPSLAFNTQQRVLDGADTFAINAIRYDGRKTTCFIDCLSGASDG